MYKLYKTISSDRPNSSILVELEDCLKQLDNFITLNSITLDEIIKITVFLDASSNSEYLKNKSTLKKEFAVYFKDDVPTISYISQGNIVNRKFLLEILSIDEYAKNQNISIHRKKYKNLNLTRVKYTHFDEIYINGITGNLKTKNFEDQVIQSFNKLESILGGEKLSFQHIIRQWNYIENITGFSKENQNYKIFNKIRSTYYEKNNLKENYPAATGIGMKNGGFVMDIIAITNLEMHNINSIDNPKQIKPYKYSSTVIQQTQGEKIDTTQKPKFERAKFIKNDFIKTLYISGTASILGEKSVYKNEILLQTETTLFNIQELLDLNLKNNSGNIIKNQLQINNFRVYLKTYSNINEIDYCCKKQFQNIEPIYLISDICREELLIEIECIAE